MPRTYKEITKGEFIDKLSFAVKNHEEFDKEILEDYGDGLRYFNWSSGALLGLNRTLVKDLRKVSFDCENFQCIERDDDVCGYKLGGIQTLENGFHFLGCAAGGDWEYPVFFIIYWDGDMFRGYVPSKGNVWDKKQKEAFHYEENEDLEPNIEDIKKDIMKRIVLR